MDLDLWPRCVWFSGERRTSKTLRGAGQGFSTGDFTEQEPLSLSLSGSVHHSSWPLIISSGQHWQAVGCITLWVSSLFFFSSSSNCCLIYCLLPHLLKSPPPGPNPHPQWQSGRVSNQNKQSPICLIETFEVVKRIKPPPSFLCSNWGWDRKTCNGCNEQWCHRNSSWLISSTRALSMWAALVHLHVHVRPLANVSTWSKWLIYTWGSPAEWGWAPYKQQIAQRSVVKAGWVQ